MGCAAVLFMPFLVGLITYLLILLSLLFKG